MPTVSSATDVMIQVHATSLNPLDVAMRGKSLARRPTHEGTLKSQVVTQLLHLLLLPGGYGAKLLKLRKNPMSAAGSGAEFPLILGRDVSGVVLDCGSEVTHFAPGDEVGKREPKNRDSFVYKCCDLVHQL